MFSVFESVVSVFLIFLSVAQYCSCSNRNLTEEQEAWLLSVSRSESFGTWPNVTKEQLNLLQSKEELFQNLTLTHHIKYNHTVDILFSSYNDSSYVVEYSDTGDSACWSGHYLAALSHKYNVTQDLTTLKLISRIVNGFELLLNCVKDKNVLTRFVGLSDDTAYELYYKGYKYHYQCNNKQLNNYNNYTWLGGVSRDQYLGTAIGFTTLFTKVYKCNKNVLITKNTKTNENENENDNYQLCLNMINETRSKVINMAESLIDDLYNNNWFIIDTMPDIQVPTNPTPIFISVFMRIAMSFNPNKYLPLFKTDYYDKWLKRTLLDREMHIKSMYFNSYFANNLCIISIATLALLENDNESKIEIFKHLKDIAVGDNGRKQLQATFPAWYITSVMSNAIINNNVSSMVDSDSDKNIVIGLLQGLLIDFPDNKWAKFVDQTTNALYFPHKDTQYSDYALLPSDRPYDTFMWQRSPAVLYGGLNEPLQYQMTDYLLPYWIAKHASIL